VCTAPAARVIHAVDLTALINSTADRRLFLGEFVRDPRNIASVTPSGPALVHQMVLPVPQRGDPVVVELGAGTGPVTRASGSGSPAGDVISRSRSTRGWRGCSQSDGRMSRSSRATPPGYPRSSPTAASNGPTSLSVACRGLERRLDYPARRPTFTETWRGDTLVIRAQCDLSAFERAQGERCGVGYVLRVPAAVTVEANVGMGKVRIDDVDGELRLSVDSGGVEIRNARGRVRVQSKSGTITATGLRGTEAIAQTGVGDVSLASPQRRCS
jgi:hypothetical protein